MKKLVFIVLVMVLMTVLLLIDQDEYLSYLDQSVSRLKQFEGDDFIRVYDTKNDSRVYITETTGYNSGLVIKVELSSNQVISVDIMSHNETDKYGGYAEQDWFRDRFVGKYSDKFVLVKKAKEEDNHIVAITGATITSQAIVDAVNKCIENYGG